MGYVGVGLGPYLGNKEWQGAHVFLSFLLCSCPTFPLFLALLRWVISNPVVLC